LIVSKIIEQKLLQDLLNSRCGNPDGNKIWTECTSLCKYHQKNDTEVHFIEIEKSKDKYFVAQRWINYLLNDRENIYFYKYIGGQVLQYNKVGKCNSFRYVCQCRYAILAP